MLFPPVCWRGMVGALRGTGKGGGDGGRHGGCARACGSGGRAAALCDGGGRLPGGAAAWLAAELVRMAARYSGSDGRRVPGDRAGSARAGGIVAAGGRV